LLKEDAISNQFDAIFDDATQATSVDMLDALTQSYKNTLLLGSVNQLSETGIKISFKLDNPRAAAYIQQYGSDQITGIDDFTKQDIRNLLRAGIENGESYTTIASAIRTRFRQYAEGSDKNTRSRSRLIAVTELGNGYAAGSHASMQAVQDSGVQMEKHWLTVGDLRVSDGCKNNQAQNWIPLNQAHLSGDMHPLRFPGCRCVEQYQRIKVVAEPQPVAKIKPQKFVPYDFNEQNAVDVNNAIGDAFPSTSSFWNKQIANVDMRAMGLYDPATGKLSLSTKYTQKAAQDERFKALIHELLHSRSKGTRDFNLEGLGWEEAIIEANAQLHAISIAKSVNYSFVDQALFEKEFVEHPYYDRWIKPLNSALDELEIDHETFYTSMLSKTCDDRKQYLRNAYKKKFPKGDEARTKFLALNKVLQ